MFKRRRAFAYRLLVLVLCLGAGLSTAPGQGTRKETTAKQAIREADPSLFAIVAPGASVTYAVALKKTFKFDPANGDGIVVTKSVGNVTFGQARMVNSRNFEIDVTSTNNGLSGSATLQINVTNGQGRRKFVRGAITVTAGNGNELVTVNGVDRTIASRLPVGARPTGIDTAGSGSDNFKTAFVCNAGSNTVSAVDIPTNTVVATIPVGSQPTNVAVAGVLGAQTAYVTNSGSGTVTAIDAQNFGVIATIDVGTSPQGIVLVGQPAFDELAYVANSGDDTLSIIDVLSNTVVDTIDVGDGPTGLAVTGRIGLQIIAVTEANDDDVRLLDANTNDTIATVDVGTRPVYVVAGGAQSNLFYVANQGSNEVSYVDTNTNSETDRVVVGSAPVSLTLASASGIEELYTANSGEGTLTVIDALKATVSLTIPVGGRPRGLATIGPASLPSILVAD